jgi:hypothetical protein
MSRVLNVGYVLYSLYVCVCVGASDSTIVCDDPNFIRSLCRVRWVLSGGVPRGPSMAVFAIFSEFCYFSQILLF